MAEDIRIFISYAHKDGSALALRLHQDLNQSGFDAWLDRRRLEAGASWTRSIEKALDEANCVLALLSPGSFTSEICRAEQLRGLRRGKCVIPVLVVRDTGIPLYLEPIQHLDFTAGAAYADSFAQLVESIRHRKGVELKPVFRTTYVTAPPLPVNYVERPDELDALREVIVRDSGGYHVALTALEGMGGIGKTILAQALCHDEVVQQAFPDGVIWVSIGKEPAFDTLTRMQEVGRALNDDLSLYYSELGATNQYRTKIREKAALIVVDDVWDVKDLRPLLAESSPRSRLLFTTRNTEIASAVGASEHLAQLLSPDQSRGVLARWSGLEPQSLPSIADGIIKECGCLALALSMVGAMLRGKPLDRWNRVLDLLRNADLEKIRIQFPEYPHHDLLRSLQVSVDELDATARDRYRKLAVLSENMSVPVQILQCLWGEAEGESADTADLFVSRSLAQRDVSTGNLALHDLQLDYTRAQYSGAEKEVQQLIRDEIMLSGQVIAKDPGQFASQMVERLTQYRDDPPVGEFLDRCTRGAPSTWLQPILPSHKSPGSALIRKDRTDEVMGVAVSADGRRAVSASSDTTLKVWDVESGRVLQTLEGHSGQVNDVWMSADGRRAVSASSDQTLKVWDMESGRVLQTLEGHSAGVNGVAVSADGRRAVSASSDQTLKVWDMESGRVLQTLEGHSGGVMGVAVSADGRRAISSSLDTPLRVWDVESGRVIQTLEGHSGGVNGVWLSADGRRAVSTSVDTTLKVWDVESGRVLQTLEGHSGGVMGVAVSADGRRAVSASLDKTSKVWDLETASVLATFTCEAEAYCCAFISATTVLVGDALGRVHWLKLVER